MRSNADYVQPGATHPLLAALPAPSAQQDVGLRLSALQLLVYASCVQQGITLLLKEELPTRPAAHVRQALRLRLALLNARHGLVQRGSTGQARLVSVARQGGTKNHRVMRHVHLAL